MFKVDIFIADDSVFERADYLRKTGKLLAILDLLDRAFEMTQEE